MKVAVVSINGERTAKTVLACTMVNIYPTATGGRESVYVTNKSLSEVLDIMEFSSEEVAIEKSIEVLTGLAVTNSISDSDITDYAYLPIRQPKAMYFDAFSEIIPQWEAYEKCMSVLKKLGNRFMVMDISGSLEDPTVADFMEEADVVLLTFRPDRRQVKQVKDYMSSLTDEEKLKIKLVCVAYDDKGISKKSILKLLGLKRPKSILWIPYNLIAEQQTFEGTLCNFIQGVAVGDPVCLNMRQPIKDLLSAIMDVPETKVIKEVNAWQ